LPELPLRSCVAAPTRERFGGLEHELACTSPAIGRHRVLVARRDVTVDFVYSLSIAAPGKPHENMPVKMHPKMRLLLARDFAFQTGDGVAPVTAREPRLVP